MKLRPCIDIHDGKVKQIVGGTLRDDTAQGAAQGPAQNFVAAHGAAYFAAIYREQGLSGGHIIMLNPSGTEAYEADKKEAMEALRAYPGGMQVGGGITPENAAAFLDAGASHVIVTSYVFRDGRVDEERLERLIREVGRDRLVLDLSCRQRDDAYVVVTDRWQKFTELTIDGKTLDALSGRCDEFLIHAADVEGKKAGIARALVKTLGDWQKESHFPLTYAGGVHDYEDIDLLRDLSGGYMDVTVGSALDLFGGSLSLESLSDRCH